MEVVVLLNAAVDVVLRVLVAVLLHVLEVQRKSHVHLVLLLVRAIATALAHQHVKTP